MTASRIGALCRDAVARSLRAVCVAPCHVSLAAREVEGSEVRVVTVANFPLGHSPPPVLRAEARAARESGADEVDVVFPLHSVAGRDWSAAAAALDAFLAGLEGLPHKVIVETAAWTEEELGDLLQFLGSRAPFAVKTSTGFHPAGGATVAAVRILRAALPDGTGVKASGGIRDRGFALELLEAGADYLGTSSAAEILDEPT